MNKNLARAPAAAGVLQEMEACQHAGGLSIMDVMYTQGKEVYNRNKGGELRSPTHSGDKRIFPLFFFFRCASAAGCIQVFIRNAKCRCKSCE